MNLKSINFLKWKPNNFLAYTYIYLEYGSGMDQENILHIKQNFSWKVQNIFRCKTFYSKKFYTIICSLTIWNFKTFLEVIGLGLFY